MTIGTLDGDALDLALKHDAARRETLYPLHSLSPQPSPVERTIMPDQAMYPPYVKQFRLKPNETAAVIWDDNGSCRESWFTPKDIDARTQLAARLLAGGQLPNGEESQRDLVKRALSMARVLIDEASK